MGSHCLTHLWEPPREVVHDHGCNQCLAKAGRQADKRVVQQRRLDDGQLVGALLNPQRVHPCLGVQPATLLQYRQENDVLVVCSAGLLRRQRPMAPVPSLAGVFTGLHSLATGLICSMLQRKYNILSSIPGMLAGA